MTTYNKHPLIKRAAILILAVLITIVTMHLTGAAHAGTVSLPQTGQTTTYAAGDDGALQKGVAWPSPRFTDNGDQTVTDNLTGLMWTKSANLPIEAKMWNDALNYVSSMNSGGGTYGYTDWRLPNINELESLANVSQASPDTWLNSQGFTNVQFDFHWSSTTYDSNTSLAWGVSVSNSDISARYKSATTTTFGRCVLDNLGHLVIRPFGLRDRQPSTPQATTERYRRAWPGQTRASRTTATRRSPTT
ncbi:MAG: DUF1566 domain-containing protein [Candidatus Magnetobacterium sp. LHC-1]